MTCTAYFCTPKRKRSGDARFNNCSKQSYCSGDMGFRSQRNRVTSPMEVVEELGLRLLHRRILEMFSRIV